MNLKILSVIAYIIKIKFDLCVRLLTKPSRVSYYCISSFPIVVGSYVNVDSYL